MNFRYLTLEHQKQIKKAIEVLKEYYTPQERLEYIGAIAEIDMAEGIKYPHYFFQMADHNSIFLEKGDTLSDIDISVITDNIPNNIRVQTLFEFKYNTGNHQTIIDNFETSNQFEHYKLLVERDCTSTTKAVLAVHSSDKLKFQLGGIDKDKAVVIKTYIKDNNGKVIATDEYVGKTVAEVKQIRKTEK